MQTNNVTDVWGTPAKVNSLQDIAKLPIKTEVSAKPVQEDSMRAKRVMTPRETIRAALDYSIKNPSVSLVSVAKLYNISDSALYNARHNFKKKLEKGAKRRTYGVALLSTSTAPLTNVSQDVVNHPAHYKTGGIETIDFIEAKKLTYNLGNVVKYITRAGVKNKATHIEDLEKAAWYLNREINNLKGGA